MTTPDQIARLRHFNRAITLEIGALDSSFLGRGRPLGLARLLCAISPEGTDVAPLRERLGLDSGFLSRMLRRLEGEQLVTLEADPKDRRRRIARLTASGHAEVQIYDQLNDARAARTLAGFGADTEALLKALTRVSTLLNRNRITLTQADPASPEAQHCLQSYFSELARRFEAGFDPGTSTEADLAMMRPPHGTFLIANCDGALMGCIGLSGDGTAVAEVKRLWIAPEARNLGLAHRLMQAVEAHAREIGVSKLQLDTNRVLVEAVRMYRSTGWQEIAPYNDNPYAHHWFEKPLAPEPVAGAAN